MDGLGSRARCGRERLSGWCADPHVDPVDRDRYVTERWETDAQLARFRGSGPNAEQTAQILDAEVWRYRISATEDP